MAAAASHTPPTLAATGPSETPTRPPPSPLALTAVEVEPASPPPETLCHLRARLENHGEAPATAFVLEVWIEGRRVPATARRLYLTDLEPGAAAWIRLPNFWSSEGGRPAPADGRLSVEVRLVEARWETIDSSRKPAVRTLGSEVPGLPLTRRIEVPIARRDLAQSRPQQSYSP